jgi:hypothetical protein
VTTAAQTAGSPRSPTQFRPDPGLALIGRTVRLCPFFGMNLLERVKGIEPSSSAWKAVALPLSYTRMETAENLQAPGRFVIWHRCCVLRIPSSGYCLMGANLPQPVDFTHSDSDRRP